MKRNEKDQHVLPGEHRAESKFGERCPNTLQAEPKRLECANLLARVENVTRCTQTQHNTINNACCHSMGLRAAMAGRTVLILIASLLFSTGMFGLGQAVTRCTKSYNTTPVPLVVKWNPLRTPRLVWVSNK